MNQPHAVLFDWDNTLIDAWPCILDCYNHTFRHFGMAEWTLEEGKQKIARSLRDTFPSMFGDRWQEAREVYYSNFDHVHLHRMVPYAHSQAMLHGLRDKGVYLGVVSNKLGKFLRTEADHLGWTPLFGALLGATDAVRDKPDPAPVHLALQPADIKPGPKVWFVGDSAVDLQCAHQSGCTAVLLRDLAPQPGEFADFPPHIHVADAQHLLSLLA